MASKEGSSWANPIRVSPGATSGGNSYKTINDKAFEKQRKGIYVQVIENSSDPNNTGYVVYRCSDAKTVKGQAIWEKIINTPVNGAAEEVAGKFIMVRTGKPGKSDNKLTTKINNKDVFYGQASVTNPRTKARINNPTNYGNFIFISLSDIEIQDILVSGDGTDSAGSKTSPGVDTTGNAGKPVQQQVGIDEEFLDKLQESNEYWDEFYRRYRYGVPRQFEEDDQSQFNKYRTPREFEEENKPWKHRVPREFEGWNPGASGPGSKAPGSGPSGGGGRGGTTTTPNRGNQSGSYQKTINVLVKSEFLDSGIVYDNTLPYIEQKYFVYDRGADKTSVTRTDVVRRHFFDIVPNSFEFSQLSSTWNDVARSGNYPLVDWSNYNLTKVSFRFLVTGVRDGSRFGNGFFSGQPLNDGLTISIDEQIDNLRAMAAAPSPVVVHNMNTLLSNSYRYPFLKKSNGISWVIADMSLTATRLTPGGKEIAAAEISITLNEYPVIERDIIRLPRLRPDRPVTTCCPSQEQDPQRDLFTNTYTFVPSVTSIAYPSPKSD